MIKILRSISNMKQVIDNNHNDKTDNVEDDNRSYDQHDNNANDYDKSSNNIRITGITQVL